MRSYTEETPSGFDLKSFINVVSPWTPHRVIVDRPMWTLFIHGPRINENWKYGQKVAPWRGVGNEQPA